MSQPTPSRPVEHIREKTTEEHERTERAVERRFFGSGEMGRDDYTEMLTAFFGLYRPLEERLASAVGRHLPPFSVRRRAERLKDDLRTLGLDDEEIEALPRLGEDRLPFLRTRPAVLGTLYVVEGSQLGHRVLWKRVRTSLKPPAREAGAFLGVPADRARTRWERFREVFDRQMSSHDALTAAVSNARATFRAYRSWLT